MKIWHQVLAQQMKPLISLILKIDSSEAPTVLGCFKLPVPPAVRRPQTITCAASCTSPAGRLESHQRGFWIETLVLCPGDLLSKSSNFFQKSGGETVPC